MKRIALHGSSLEERRDLCLQLLSEFGAANVSVNESTHEIVHSCCLPFGGHSNGDRTPSASVNYEKLTYICRAGCGSGGFLWWVATCRGTPAAEVRTWLSAFAGEDPDSVHRLLDFIESLYAPAETFAEPIPEYSVRVLEPWAFVHPYLTEVRGIPEENVVACQVGYDLAEQRIVVPHFWRGSLVGWQKRRMVSDGSPKWQSSSSFPKSRTLYRMPPMDQVPVVVEAPLSVVAKLHVAPSMCATFGASISPEQVSLLARYERVILWLDNDRAGWTATRALAESLEATTVVLVVDSPFFEDPTELPDDVVASLIDSAVPYPVWQQPKENEMRKYGSPEKIYADQEDPQGVDDKDIEKSALLGDQEVESEEQ